MRFNRVRTSERRTNGDVDHTGSWTMFGTAMNALKTNDYQSLRLNDSDSKAWNADFEGENASDAGGPYRDSVSNIIDEVHSACLPLLIPTPNQKNTHGFGRDLWTINIQSKTADHLEMYRFLGALMGLAFRSGQVINLKLPSIIWKKFTGEQATLEDLMNLDAYAAQHLQEIRESSKSVSYNSKNLEL